MAVETFAVYTVSCDIPSRANLGIVASLLKIDVLEEATQYQIT